MMASRRSWPGCWPRPPRHTTQVSLNLGDHRRHTDVRTVAEQGRLIGRGEVVGDRRRAERHWRPRAARRGHAARQVEAPARCRSGRSLARMPYRPRAAHSAIFGTSACRRAGVSNLLSRTPVGAVGVTAVTTTTPTLTGPLRAPRPASLAQARAVTPVRSSARLYRSVGRLGGHCPLAPASSAGVEGHLGDREGVTRLSGHTFRNTRPTTLSTGTAPSFSLRW